MVPAGQGFAGSGSIGDPVNCQGTIAASPAGRSISTEDCALRDRHGPVGRRDPDQQRSRLRDQRRIAFRNVPVRGQRRHGDLHAVRRDQHASATNLYLGYNAGDSGTYNLSGVAQLSASNEYVGYSGTGNFTQSGGTNGIRLNGYLYLGYESREQRHLHPQRQRPVVGEPSYVSGYFGHGELYTVGRDQQRQHWFRLSWHERRRQRHVQSQRQRPVVGDTPRTWAYSGTGTFTQSAGPTASASYLYLGTTPAAAATYNLSGGQLVGILRVRGLLRHGNLHAVRRDQQHQQLSLSRLQRRQQRHVQPQRQRLPVRAYYEYVGYSGTGTFTQSGGTNSISNYLYLGYNAGGSGTYSLSGSGQLSAAGEYVGYTAGATASFQQTGGTNTTSLLSIGTAAAIFFAGGLCRSTAAC